MTHHAKSASTAQLKKTDPEDIKKQQCIHRMIQPANHFKQNYRV